MQVQIVDKKTGVENKFMTVMYDNLIKYNPEEIILNPKWKIRFK